MLLVEAGATLRAVSVRTPRRKYRGADLANVIVA